MSEGGNVIRVTPTVSVAAYANNDVLFNSIEVPNAVGNRGGVSKLVGLSMINYADNAGATADHDFELIFHQKGGIDLGTINEQPDISDDNFRSLKFLAWREVKSGDWITNQSSSDGAVSLYTSAATTNDPTGEMLLKAEEGSRSIYISGINGNDAIDYVTAKDLEIILHVQYL
tara:strand:- start:1100 stop:1618 length:519 start_codon:yes stop_codon:yes gene_type:complete